MSQPQMKFAFSLDEINAVLTILGDAPYSRSAKLIALIQKQGAEYAAEIEAYEAAQKEKMVVPNE
jgi:hypothetical protein